MLNAFFEYDIVSMNGGIRLKTDTDNKMGEMIRTLRTLAGLTQKELAEKVGVSTITIQQYERNVRTPRLEIAEKIAKILGDEWYKKDVERNDKELELQLEAAYKAQFSFDEEDMEKIFEAMKMLNADGQRVAVERIQELTEISKYRRRYPSQSAPVSTPDKDPAKK